MNLIRSSTDPSGYARFVAVAIALAASFALYFDTVRSFVAIWNSSETFAHGYIILPISLWLIWGRRDDLARIPQRPYWPGLLLLALCGFSWLLGQLGDVQVVRQFAFVAMLPTVVMTVLGVQFARAIAFPLLFLFFAVPVGEVFIAPLIEFTATFTVAALQLTGIPVLREGPNFTIPSGSWSVVEACSGVRYLISSITLGCLYAYLTYRTRWRQALFVLISILVPILANGIRAYLIVMIGHLSGMELAVGADHLIYGWLFFGLVMFIMFWIGSYWREAPAEPGNAQAEARPSDQAASATSLNRKMFAAGLAAMAFLGIWPLHAYVVGSMTSDTPAPALNALHPNAPEAPAFTLWRASYSPAPSELHRHIRNGDQTVGVSIRYYRNQHAGSKLITSTNRMIAVSDEQFRKIGEAKRTESIDATALPIHETVIAGGQTSFVVWTWYWIDGRFINNDYLGKLLQAKERFLLRGDDGATLMVYARYSDRPEEARATLRAFLGENLASWQTMLSQAKTK